MDYPALRVEGRSQQFHGSTCKSVDRDPPPDSQVGTHNEHRKCEADCKILNVLHQVHVTRI